MTIFSKAFVLDAGERAVKAFAGGVLTAIAQGPAGIDLFHADLVKDVELGGSLALVSVLMSLASAKASGISPASLVPAAVVPADAVLPSPRGDV